jgi:hypothetical protein
MRTLSRENIHSIHKKSKLLRTSLSQMLKKTSPSSKESAPVSSLESSKILNAFRIVKSGSATQINP